MDKKVVRRMIKRLTAVPESYEQGAMFVEEDDRAPCGTVACLAGEAVICSAKTVEAGIKLAFSGEIDLVEHAEAVLGLTGIDHCVFSVDASGWPIPFRYDFTEANSREEEARVAVAYLKEALKRGTMVWTSNDSAAA
jgi:UDP-3-O-acyl-N-acetylglucosamine deacetylase